MASVVKQKDDRFGWFNSSIVYLSKNKGTNEVIVTLGVVDGKYGNPEKDGMATVFGYESPTNMYDMIYPSDLFLRDDETHNPAIGMYMSILECQTHQTAIKLDELGPYNIKHVATFVDDQKPIIMVKGHPLDTVKFNKLHAIGKTPEVLGFTQLKCFPLKTFDKIPPHDKEFTQSGMDKLSARVRSVDGRLVSVDYDSFLSVHYVLQSGHVD